MYVPCTRPRSELPGVENRKVITKCSINSVVLPLDDIQVTQVSASITHQTTPESKRQTNLYVCVTQQAVATQPRHIFFSSFQTFVIVSHRYPPSNYYLLLYVETATDALQVPGIH